MHAKYKCRGCGVLEQPEGYVTAPQRTAGQGFWTAPPAGWLRLTDADRAPDRLGGLWVCSTSCADALDAEEA